MSGKVCFETFSTQTRGGDFLICLRLVNKFEEQLKARDVYDTLSGCISGVRIICFRR